MSSRMRWPWFALLVLIVASCSKTTYQAPPGGAAPDRRGPSTEPVPRNPAAGTSSNAWTEREPARPSVASGTHDGHDPVMARYDGREIRASELGVWFLKTYRREALAAISKLVGLEIVQREADKIGLHCPPGYLARKRQETVERLERDAALNYGLGTTAERYVRLKYQQSLADHLALQEEQERQRWLFGRIIRFDAIRTDRVQLAMIVTRDRKVAEEVASRLDQGADFARLAARHSIHESRKDGGKLPPLPREALTPAVATRAFQMRAGERTGILEVDDGRGQRQFEIVRVVKHLRGRKVSWRDVAAEVEADLAVRPVDPLEWTAWYLRLERLYNVQVTGNL